MAFPMTDYIDLNVFFRKPSARPEGYHSFAWHIAEAPADFGTHVIHTIKDAEAEKLEEYLLTLTEIDNLKITYYISENAEVYNTAHYHLVDDIRQAHTWESCMANPDNDFLLK